MEMPEYTLEFYIDARGKCLLEDWLEGLKEPVSRQRIKARLVRLRLGNWGDC
jgi:putative component of toxin-antitoxin plasmid stabilization module